MSSVNEASRQPYPGLTACLHPAPGAPASWPQPTEPPVHDTWAQMASEPAWRQPFWLAPEAEAIRQAYARADQPLPTADDVAAMRQYLAHEPEARPVANAVAGLMTGIDAHPQPPTPAQWERALTPLVQNKGPYVDPARVHAFVFAVMLEAQRAATEEKRDSLRTLKMYGDMIEALNDRVARNLTPAMQGLRQDLAAQGEAQRAAGGRKNKATDPDRAARVEKKVDFPLRIDTRWGAVDPDTGKVSLIVLEDAPQKQDLQTLTALIGQSDQWRTTMQNQQTKQSMDFQRIDNAMSNTYNLLTSFLKAAQDSVNAIIRNGLG